MKKTVVPLASSQRLYSCLAEVLGQDHVSFRIEPNMGHASDPLYADTVLSEIDEWMSGKA